MNSAHVTGLPLQHVFLLLAWVLASAFGTMFLLRRAVPSLSSSTAHRETAWVDGLRGVAATLVVLNHAPLALTHFLNLTPAAYRLSEDGIGLLNYLGATGVQMFFCITGCLFAGKLSDAQQVDWTDFFVKRLRRLVPAYAAAVVLAVVVAFGFAEHRMHFLVGAILGLPSMLSFGVYPLPEIDGFAMSRLLGVNWSLAYEWGFYVLLPLVFAIMRWSGMSGLSSICGAAIAFWFVQGPGLWAYFVVGAIGSLLLRFPVTHSQKIASRLVLFVAVASMCLNWELLAQSPTLKGMHVCAAFLSLALARPAALGQGTWAALGTVSYSLYLFHVIVLFVVFQLFHVFVEDVTTLEPVGVALLAGLAVSLATALSAASYLKIERPFLGSKSAGAPRRHPTPERG